MQCLCTYVWNIKLYWGYVSHFFIFAALESQNSIPWSSFQATGNIITSWGSWSPDLRDPGDSAARPPPWRGIYSAARSASSASSMCTRSASFVSSPPRPLAWKATMMRWWHQNVNWLLPLAVKFLPLGDGHVDVARGGAVADPHAHCASQRHSEQTDKENLGTLCYWALAFWILSVSIWALKLKIKYFLDVFSFSHTSSQS